jgi:hypothetical protein
MKEMRKKNYRENSDSDDDEESTEDGEKKKKAKKRKNMFSFSSSSSPRKKINKKEEVVAMARQVETNLQTFEDILQRGVDNRESLLVLFQNTVKDKWKDLHDKIEDKFGVPRKQ